MISGWLYVGSVYFRHWWRLLVWQKTRKNILLPSSFHRFSFFIHYLPELWIFYFTTRDRSLLKSLGPWLKTTSKFCLKIIIYYQFFRSLTVILQFSTSIRPPPNTYVGLLENKLNHSFSVFGFRSGFSLSTTTSHLLK